MKKINKVCSVICSVILGIQAMGSSAVFAEMSFDERNFFNFIEESRHNFECRNGDYQALISFINKTVHEWRSVDFKLYCLSILFKLGANAGDINRFIAKNEINLDDTSNLYYINLIYRSIYYCRKISSQTSINKELEDNLVKIIDNGSALLSRILSDKKEFIEYPNYLKKYIMRSVYCIRECGFTCIPEEKLESFLKSFTSEDFKSSVTSLFSYIKLSEIDNLTKIKLIEEVTQGFRNIDELLKNRDCRLLLIEYSGMPEADCRKRYRLMRELIEYYRNTMSMPDNPTHDEYSHYLEAMSLLATIPEGDNNYKKEVIQEFLKCYKKNFKKSALSNEQNAKMIIFICNKNGIDSRYRIKLVKKIMKYHKELNDPLYEEAVLICGKIPEYDMENKRKLLGELIEYYRKNSKDILVNPTYQKLVLVYGRIPGGDSKYKEILIKELINDYKIRLGKSALSDYRYEQLALTYARIPEEDLENKEKLLKELIEYCSKNSKNVEDKLKNPLYEEAVLIYGRKPGGDLKNKEKLLKELIDFYKTARKYDSLANETMAVYVKIPRSDLKNKIKYLKKLVKAGLAEKYKLLKIIRNIMNYEHRLEDSQFSKLRKLEKKCLDEEIYGFGSDSSHSGLVRYSPSTDSRDSKRPRII